MKDSATSVSGMMTELLVCNELRRSISVSLAFAYFSGGVVFCLSSLCWITVPNKRMSNLDSLICAGMASMKRLVALSKIQDGDPYLV